MAREISAHKATSATHEWGLIFTNDWGAPIQQSPFATTFARAVRDAGLPEWATPHDLRHYYASVLIAGGASVKVVQTRLGHSSARVTRDTYTHLWPEEESRSRQVIEDEFGKFTSELSPS